MPVSETEKDEENGKNRIIIFGLEYCMVHKHINLPTTKFNKRTSKQQYTLLWQNHIIIIIPWKSFQAWPFSTQWFFYGNILQHEEEKNIM